MNSALIVVDVQRSFVERPDWELVSNPKIVESVNRLVESARAAGQPVFWVLHSEPGTGSVFDPASGFVRPMAGLDTRPDDPLLVKTAHNAFTTTNLQQQLTARGITALTVGGIRTEQCCETTTRIGADLGFAMTFVTEATATHPIAHRDRGAMNNDEIMADPRTLHTSAIIERTEYALAGRFATISTLDEVAA
jgi:nicotinamidase-related amidase